jgi:2-(1,2-epoxy-1,2-dihydrophenyl)acetyl-CoA isomerase
MSADLPLAEVVVVRRDGPVVELVLNRPEVLNALDRQLVTALRRELGQLRHMPEVRAVMLSGAGRAFCAGSDLVAMRERPVRVQLTGEERSVARAAEEARLEWAFTAVLELFELGRPTVAALHGAVAGGGLGLALACDFRVAARSARLVTAYRALGLPGDWGVTALLPVLAGRQVARRLLMRGATLGAEEALALGLVDEVVPDEDLPDAGRALAVELAGGPSYALGEVKRLITGVDLRRHLHHEIQATLRCQETVDHAEGLAAFFERRPPRFCGR